MSLETKNVLGTNDNLRLLDSKHASKSLPRAFHSKGER